MDRSAMIEFLDRDVPGAYPDSDDTRTASWSHTMHMLHNDEKSEMLEAMGDTHSLMTFAQALDWFRDFGFEELEREPVERITRSDERSYQKREGVLLVLESYGARLGLGRMFFNARRPEGYRGRLLGSETGTVAGAVNATDGFRLRWEQMHNDGIEFLSEWVLNPCEHAPAHVLREFGL